MVVELSEWLKTHLCQVSERCNDARARRYLLAGPPFKGWCLPAYYYNCEIVPNAHNLCEKHKHLKLQDLPVVTGCPTLNFVRVFLPKAFGAVGSLQRISKC